MTDNKLVITYTYGEPIVKIWGTQSVVTATNAGNYLISSGSSVTVTWKKYTTLSGITGKLKNSTINGGSANTTALSRDCNTTSADVALVLNYVTLSKCPACGAAGEVEASTSINRYMIEANGSRTIAECMICGYNTDQGSFTET